MGSRRLFTWTGLLFSLVYVCVNAHALENEFAATATKRKSAMTFRRAPAATTKKAPAPQAKKNLKKGKNLDTSARKSGPTTPRITRLPTRTRGEVLAEQQAAAKIEAEKKARELATTAANSVAAPAAGVAAPVANAPSEATANSASASDEISAGGEEEVALDLGGAAGEPEKWNPYTFGRSTAWIFFPLLTLIIVGLHLLPVPKRIYAKRLASVPDFLKLKDKPAPATSHGAGLTRTTTTITGITRPSSAKKRDDSNG